MTDKPARCGAKHPKQKNEACTRDVGHVGMHSNGGNVTWKKTPADAAPAKPKPEKAVKPCGDTMAGIACTQPKGHKGDHVGKGGTWARDRQSGRFDCKPDEHGDETIMATGGNGTQGDPAAPSEDGVMKQTAGRHLFDNNGDVEVLAFVEPSALADLPDVTIQRVCLDADDDDPYEDEIRSDEDRDFARKMREDREAHARELEISASTSAMVNGAVGDNGRILGYRRHPAAALFPMLEGDDFERFADRIQASGLREPIVLVTLDGEDWILDGSNRALACERRSVTPRFEHYTGPTDADSLTAYSLDKNGDGRRHLDLSVRAMIAAEAAKLGRGNPGDRETGRSAGLMTQAEAGKRLGVSERLVRRAVVVRDKATPAVKEAVMKGRLAVEAAEVVTKLPQAKQDEIAAEALARKSGAIKSGRVRALVKQEEKRAVVRKINEQRVAPMPVGAFGVIYVDWPWQYDNSDQHEGSRGHLPYPPMAIDAIVALARKVASRGAKDCVIATWTTNLHVINGNVGRVVEAYGATPHSMFTWPKPRMGVGTWGRGQTEHLVIASIGNPVHTLNEISTLLPAWKPEHPGEHSSKPAEVAELLAKHCAGPFLELFGRGPRDRWTVWGAEVDKFAAEAA